MRRSPAIISFISDFGGDDHFVGVVKGVILKIHPKAQVIDICHNIPAQDIFHAACLLSSSYHYFPYHTVHLAVVDPGVGSARRPILIQTKNYFFLGPDNGLFSFVLEKEPPLKIIQLTEKKFFLPKVSTTFQARDIFAPVAAWLTRGKGVEDFGKSIAAIEKLSFPQPLLGMGQIQGEVLWIDHFGNLITNISEQLLAKFGCLQNCRIRIKNHELSGLSHCYSEKGPEKPLALIGSSGYLEIAVNMGSAEDFFKAKKKDKVVVFWK